MASTSTSFSQVSRGFVRIENPHSLEQFDYPLYEASTVQSTICLDTSSPVVENSEYNLFVLVPEETPIVDFFISINGTDYPSSTDAQPSLETIAGERYWAHRVLAYKQGGRRPFLLTYGFARIEISLAFQQSPENEIFLTTKDIPCLSNEEHQTVAIEQMLNQLLDTEEETVAGWMFCDGENARAPFSIIDASLRNKSPKSLSSIVQMLESVIEEYEKNYIFFQSHAFCKIKRTAKKLSPRQIRRTESAELFWISKNSHVLTETPFETSINYLGKYYLPREVETGVRMRSFDNYENRLILGFLNEILTRAKAIHATLVSDTSHMHSLIQRLNVFNRDGYTLPAISLIRQCEARENYFSAKLHDIIKKARGLKLKYETALPEVRAQFSRSPKRTKVFQEIRCYSGIYELILRWLKFGDFSLARESLALHTLRLDKLYEHYALFRILCWLHALGFERDESESAPIERAVYSLTCRYYSNEQQVSTLYKLSRGNLRIKLYYQPVIYGDEHEENGITLHRLSCRNPKSEYKRDSYWTPDFLLKVNREQEGPVWHVLDAKYSKASNLWDGYPKEGIFTETVSKYKTDIGGSSPYDKVTSVWLINGRDQGYTAQFAELSSWASQNYSGTHSGIGALTPTHSCLDVILPPLFELEGESIEALGINKQFEDLPIHHTSATPSFQSQSEAISPFSRNGLHRERKQACLPLIEELYSLIDSNEALYKSRWSEVNLGIAHPLLRKSCPAGRERRYYSKMELNGESCYVYINWLPHQENKLRYYIAKCRSKQRR